MLKSRHDGKSCPTCHQLWPSSTLDDQDTTAMGSPDVIDPQYFRMLGHSIYRDPIASSQPSSPRRRLVQNSPSSTQPWSDSTGSLGSDSNVPPAADPHSISSSAFSQDYFRKFFVEECVLGRGGRGVVLLVAHVLDGVRLGQFACKRVPVGDDHAWLKKILTEVQTLQNLSHQNLVSYRHVWLESVQISKFGPAVPSAFILQQYCNGGDLHNYVYGPTTPSVTTEELKNRVRRRSRGGGEIPSNINGPKKLPLDEIYSFFKDITAGLRFLHASGYVHRDLKPSNCLLHHIGGEARVLVSDFGEVQATTATRRSTGSTGTISYCAPEVLRRESPGGPYQNFTVKSDIFSLGMILYFLCFATLPYRNACVINEEEEDLDDLKEEILQWSGLNDGKPRRLDLPEKLYIFIRRLLALHPQQRPSADEVDHAIRTGDGLQDIPTTFGHQDHSQADRITVIDNSTRPNLSFRRTIRRKGHPTSISRRSSSRLRHLSRTSSSSMQPGDDVVSSSDVPSPRQELMRISPSTPEQGMELRASPSYPPWNVPSDERNRLLLPPSSGSSWIQRFFSQRRSLLLWQLTRTILFLAKITTLVSGCGASAVRSIIVYPLLFAAVFEFTVRTRVWLVLSSSMVHGLVLVVAYQKQSLCVIS